MYAIKEFNIKHNPKEKIKEIEQEVNIQKRLGKHDNILELKENF